MRPALTNRQAHHGVAFALAEAGHIEALGFGVADDDRFGVPAVPVKGRQTGLTVSPISGSSCTQAIMQ